MKSKLMPYNLICKLNKINVLAPGRGAARRPTAMSKWEYILSVIFMQMMLT